MNKNDYIKFSDNWNAFKLFYKHDYKIDESSTLFSLIVLLTMIFNG